MEQVPQKFLDRSYELGSRLRNWNSNKSILIIGHRDADGVSAASVLFQGLQELGFGKITTKILLSPDIEALRQFIAEGRYEYAITGDIGAGFGDLLRATMTDFIIADHHPNKTGVYSEHQLNPCVFGMNDEVDCSGSTLAGAILLDTFEDPEIWASDRGRAILSYAVSGAVGDFQVRHGPVAWNKYLFELARDFGAIVMGKDVCFFGRGMYPVHVALHRSGLPGLQDLQVCQTLVSQLFPLKNNGYWRRIIDLTQDEKRQFVGEVMTYLTQEIGIDISELMGTVVNYVYDLLGLTGWSCTQTMDGRFTLDAREILHRVNYVCRRGKADLALQLLNNQFIDIEFFNNIESYHKTGDREVAQALNLYERGAIPIESWDERVIMADFTNNIFFDEVGVIAGVIMNKTRNIEVMLSYCELEDQLGMVKISTRAREDVWQLIEAHTAKPADAKHIYTTLKGKYPTQVGLFGGHRWACSGVIRRELIHEFFELLVQYYQQLIPLNPKETKTPNWKNA